MIKTTLLLACVVGAVLADQLMPNTYQRINEEAIDPFNLKERAAAEHFYRSLIDDNRPPMTSQSPTFRQAPMADTTTNQDGTRTLFGFQKTVSVGNPYVGYGYPVYGAYPPVMPYYAPAPVAAVPYVARPYGYVV